MQNVSIREFQLADWEEAWALWESTLPSNDSTWSKERVEVFLHHNEGLSLSAVIDGHLAGTVMCGFDGRRGYIYHLAVSPKFRRQGMGTALTKAAVNKLKSAGATKIHLMIHTDNDDAHHFYETLGFSDRFDIYLMSSTAL